MARSSATRIYTPCPTDYSVFAHPDFDPNDYANTVLAGEPYPAPISQTGATTIKSAKAGKSTTTGSDAEDISVAISKLSFNIEDMEKQLKNVVSCSC